MNVQSIESTKARIMNIIIFVALFYITFMVVQRVNCTGSYIYDDNLCGKPCKGPNDCDSSESYQSCNVCASRNYGDLEGIDVGKKICMSHHEMSCGGPPLPRKSSLPQYLVIGDSITRGLFRNLTLQTKGFAEAYLNTGTPNTTADGVDCVDVWIGSNPDRWDVISFNFGLTDIEVNVDIIDYQVNLKNMTTSFATTKAAKNGGLIFVLTTPTANSTDCCPTNDSLVTTKLCPRSIEEFNAKARQTMLLFQLKFKIHVTIDDLWGWVNLHCCHHQECQYESCDFQPSPPPCQTDFNGANGWEYLALNVSNTVKHILKP